MAKLNFRYGAMNSGKTTILIQTAYNYEERGHNVIVIKPLIDTKGNDTIVSRIGASRKVNGNYVTSGDSVVIDGSLDVSYESLCGKCYIKKILKK